MQPTPQVTAQDVDRVVRRDFPGVPLAGIYSILARYGEDSFHRETDRVRLAVLKLASGDVSRLKTEIEGATCDYRDTLAAAEYPGYSKKMFHIDRLAETEKKKIIDSDWIQYEEWLRKT